MTIKNMSPDKLAFQKKTGLTLGKRIYSGHGDIYKLKNYPNRLVKIVEFDDLNDFKIIKYLHRSKNPSVVKLHKVGVLRNVKDEYGDVSSYYYYIMDKLSLIPKKCRQNYVNEIDLVLSCGEYISNDIPRKIKYFVKKARQLKYDHHDIHSYNIMQNKKGSLKFVDLESFMW
jgi:hypothetical protein